MSADNFYLIRRLGASKFVAIMGFASDDTPPTIDPQRSYAVFLTPELALRSVRDKYAEYGHSIHPECRLSKRRWRARKAQRTAAIERFRTHLAYNDEDETVDDQARRLVAIAESVYLNPQD